MVRAADQEYFATLNQARSERRARGLCAASGFGGRQVQQRLRPAEESPRQAEASWLGLGLGVGLGLGSGLGLGLGFKF